MVAVRTYPHTPNTAFTYLPPWGPPVYPPTQLHRWTTHSLIWNGCFHLGTGPVTHSSTSLQRFSCSLLSIKFSQPTGLFPSTSKQTVIFPVLSFSVPHKILQCHSNTSGSVEGNTSLTLEEKYLYLLFQSSFSCPLLKLFYCSFHPHHCTETAVKMPRGFHLDQQHLTQSITPSSLMYILQLLPEYQNIVF